MSRNKYVELIREQYLLSLDGGSCCLGNVFLPFLYVLDVKEEPVFLL